MPVRNRATHATEITRQLDHLAAIWAQSEERLEGSRGHLATAEALPGASLALDSLGDKRTDVAVVEGEGDRALLHVRNDDLSALRKKVNAYAERDTSKGRPSNEPLVAPLEVLREATIQDVVVGELAQLMIDADTNYWVELWTDGGRLASEDKRLQIRRVIDELAALSGDSPEAITFTGTERDIHLARISGAVLLDLPRLAPDVYRVARPAQARADRLARDYAGELVEDLDVIPRHRNSTVVSVLDTGVAETHPLLGPLMASRGVSVVPGELSAIDSNGHGTELAGVAAFGEVLSTALLEGTSFIARARLENVRCFAEGGNQPLWAARTEAAVEAAEGMGERRRVFNLALSDPGDRSGDRTSWSSALDRLAHADEEGRLFCVAVGNADQFGNPADYPVHNLASFVHDPGHAANVVTVGAMTHKDSISTPGALAPIAAAGETSPYTSSNVSATTAIKPDIVLEGGNACPDGTIMNVGEQDLSTLTVDHRHASGHLLSWTWATSAACAAASGLTAEIWDANPERSPQTVRALLVHSARWTPEIWQQHPDKRDRLRIAGYGVPRRSYAIASATNRPTLIHEGQLAPNRPVADAARGMQLLQLPLPHAELLALSDAPVELAATLSFFGEPNEARRSLYFGATLAWDLQRRGETADEFVRRVSDNWRPRGTPRPPAADAWDWEIGPEARARGTVQSDRMRTDAASLAGDKLAAIWPIRGWWSDHTTRDDASINYAFVLSIDAGEADIDLHALVEARLQVPVEVDAS